VLAVKALEDNFIDPEEKGLEFLPPFTSSVV
jgi:hypothetical protein